MEIQVLYTMNILVSDLLIAGEQPTAAHLEALVGTLMAWGRIRGEFALAEQSRANPQEAVQLLKRLLDVDIGDEPLRDYTSSHDITSIGKRDMDKIVVRAVKAFGGKCGTTWTYKTLHIVALSILPAFDSNIACRIFSDNPQEGSCSLSRRKYDCIAFV